MINKGNWLGLFWSRKKSYLAMVAPRESAPKGMALFEAHKNTASMDQWLAAYCAELTYAHALRPHGPVQTVFFGGGTPSLMPPDLVAAILAHIDRLWGLADHVEISLEANPVSAPTPHLQALRGAAAGGHDGRPLQCR